MPLFCFCILKIVFSNRCDCLSVFPYVSGLSYRKGLLALRSANVDSVVVSRPLDIAVAFSQLPVQRSLSATFITNNYNNSICRCIELIVIVWHADVMQRLLHHGKAAASITFAVWPAGLCSNQLWRHRRRYAITWSTARSWNDALHVTHLMIQFFFWNVIQIMILF